MLSHTPSGMVWTGFFFSAFFIKCPFGLFHFCFQDFTITVSMPACVKIMTAAAACAIIRPHKFNENFIVNMGDGSFFVLEAGRLPSDAHGLLPAQDMFDCLDGGMKNKLSETKCL